MQLNQLNDWDMLQLNEGDPLSNFATIIDTNSEPVKVLTWDGNNITIPGTRLVQANGDGSYLLLPE